MLLLRMLKMLIRSRRKRNLFQSRLLFRSRIIMMPKILKFTLTAGIRLILLAKLIWMIIFICMMSREKWTVKRLIKLIFPKDLLIFLLARKMEKIDIKSEATLRNSKNLLFNPRLIRTIISSPLPIKVPNYFLSLIKS